MFKNIIVKKPCPAICDGISSSENPQIPDYKKALIQHESYIKTMEQCGVKVTVLENSPDFPDSCFVEDVAVLTSKCAIITNPGADSRNGEIKEIIPVIETFYPSEKIHYIKSPATLDGGDVMMIEDTFYVGKSDRTNDEGIAQFIAILNQYGLKGIKVTLTEVLHLKTGVNYLDNNTLLVSGEFVDHPLFKDFKKIIITEDELYSANCVFVNGKVIVPTNYPKTKQSIIDAGYDVLTTDTSEYKKIDGGLSCLSLRF